MNKYKNKPIPLCKIDYCIGNECFHDTIESIDIFDKEDFEKINQFRDYNEQSLFECNGINYSTTDPIYIESQNETEKIVINLVREISLKAGIDISKFICFYISYPIIPEKKSDKEKRKKSEILINLTIINLIKAKEKEEVIPILRDNLSFEEQINFRDHWLYDYQVYLKGQGTPPNPVEFEKLIIKILGLFNELGFPFVKEKYQ